MRRPDSKELGQVTPEMSLVCRTYECIDYYDGLLSCSVCGESRGYNHHYNMIYFDVRAHMGDWDLRGEHDRALLYNATSHIASR